MHSTLKIIGRDDCLDSLSQKTAASSKELFHYDVGIENSDILDNVKQVIDDIMKEVDKLVYDPDDVPYFEIEAIEDVFLDKLRQHFATDAEDENFLSNIRYPFVDDSDENCSIKDIRTCSETDTGENYLVKDMKLNSEIGIAAEENKCVISSSVIGRGGNNNLENVGEHLNGSSIKNENFLALDELFGDKSLLPGSYGIAPSASSNKENGAKSLFLFKGHAVESGLPLHCTKLISNDSKLIDSSKSDAHVEKMKNNFYIGSKKNVSTEKTDDAQKEDSSFSEIKFPIEIAEELSPEKSHSVWEGITKTIERDEDCLLPISTFRTNEMSKDIFRGDCYKPGRHLKDKVFNGSLAENEKIPAEQNKPITTEKAVSASSTILNGMVFNEAAEEPFHSLKAINVQELEVVRSATPLNVADSKEPSRSSLGENHNFDWRKWADTYDSDKEDLQPLPTFRMIKLHRRKKSVRRRLFSCICVTNRKSKKSKKCIAK